MFKRYKIKFNKYWDSQKETIVTDYFLAKTAVNIALNHNLDVEKLVLDNTFECCIILRGEKLDFLHFVDDFLEKVGKRIENISF